MNRFCTSKVVFESPISGQLHEALPGPVVATGVLAGFSARSVPSVDSAIVFKLPTAMIRQGVDHGRVDSGFTDPPWKFSRGSGKPIEYSPLGDSARNRVPQ